MNGNKKNVISLKLKEEAKKKLEYSNFKKITQSKLKEQAKELDPIKKLVIQKSSLEMLTRSLKVEKFKKILNPLPLNRDTVSTIELSSSNLTKSVKFPIRYVNIRETNPSMLNNYIPKSILNKNCHSKVLHVNNERSHNLEDSNRIEKRLSIINNECLPKRLRNKQLKIHASEQNKHFFNSNYGFNFPKENNNFLFNTPLKTFQEHYVGSSFNSKIKLRIQDEGKNYEYTSKIYPKIRAKFYNFSKKFFGDVKQPEKIVDSRKSPEIKNILNKIEKLRNFRLNLIEDKDLGNISTISIKSTPMNE